MTLREIVSVHPEVMHGTPVFSGTRVPIQALLDHLEAGDSFDAFLDDSPSVTREQAVKFIDLAGQQAVDGLIEALSTVAPGELIKVPTN